MPNTVTFRGADAIELVATQRGPEDGPPILLLHGGGQTRGAWGASLETLAGKGFNAVSLDLRGHGDSEWASDGQYALGAFADDLRNVVATFRTPPAFVGASLGGLASLLAVGEAPAAPARAIVLVDVVPWMERKGGEQVVGFMRSTSHGFDSLEDAADAVSEYLPHRPRPERLDGLARNMRRRSDGRWYWHWDPAFVAPQRGWDMDEINRRLTAAVRTVPGPLLLVRGTNSEIVSDEGVRRFRDMRPDGKVVEIEGAHHMVAGDDNEAFLDALMPFLERDGARAA